MAIRNVCGFDTGDASELIVASGTFSFVTSPVHSTAGGYAVRTNPTTTGAGFVGIVAVSATGSGSANFVSSTLRVRFWFRYTTKPASASEEIFATLAASKNVTAHIRIDSAGKLSVWKSNTTQLGSTGATVLAADTWYRIEFKIVSGAWELKINGTVEVSGSDAQAWSQNQVRFGKVTNRNGNSVDFFYDDVAVDDAAYPGDGQCALLVPNGAGTYQTFTRGGADSGANWSQVDEVPHNSDTDYLVSTDVVNDAETETLTTVTVSSVLAVKGFAIAKRDGAGDGLITGRLRSGTTDSDSGTSVAPSTTYIICYARGINATDPATGSAWTQSGIDGIQIGCLEADATDRSRVTFIGAVVDYVPGVAPTAPPIAIYKTRRQRIIPTHV